MLPLLNSGNQSTQSPPVAVDPPTTDLPASSRGIPTPEALRIVLQQAQRLLGGSAVESLSVCTKAYCFILPFAAHTCFVLVAQSSNCSFMCRFLYLSFEIICYGCSE